MYIDTAKAERLLNDLMRTYDRAGERGLTFEIELASPAALSDFQVAYNVHTIATMVSYVIDRYMEREQAAHQAAQEEIYASIEIDHIKNTIRAEHPNLTESAVHFEEMCIEVRGVCQEEGNFDKNQIVAAYRMLRGLITIEEYNREKLTDYEYQQPTSETGLGLSDVSDYEAPVEAPVHTTMYLMVYDNEGPGDWNCEYHARQVPLEEAKCVKTNYDGFATDCVMCAMERADAESERRSGC